MAQTARRAARCWPALALGLLSVLGAAAWAQAPLSAQERLDAIRMSLVEASLQSATQVTSVTWVDSRGGLHELSSFKNRMQFQGVNVVGFDRDVAGQPKAQLKLGHQAQGHLAGVETGPKPAGGDPLAQEGAETTLKHVVRFTLSMQPGIHPVIETHMPLLLRERWLQESAQPKQQIWRWVPDLAKPLLSEQLSPYERVLLSHLPRELPWHATLSLRTRTVYAATIGAWQQGAPNGIELTMKLSLRATDGRLAPLEAQAQLLLDLDLPQWGRPTLSNDSKAAVLEQLRQWQRVMHQWLRREAVRPEVTAMDLPRVRINAGSVAGVRPGDEWLLADPNTFPSRLLAAEGASQTLLARVETVSQHESVLSVLAGPAQAAATQWRAWPVQLLVNETTARETRPRPKR